MEFSRQEYWSGLPLPSPANRYKCLQSSHQHTCGPHCGSSAVVNTWGGGGGCQNSASPGDTCLQVPSWAHPPLNFPNEISSGTNCLLLLPCVDMANTHAHTHTHTHTHTSLLTFSGGQCPCQISICSAGPLPKAHRAVHQGESQGLSLCSLKSSTKAGSVTGGLFPAHLQGSPFPPWWA